MRKSMAVPAVAAALALSGCGQQALVGERAYDPVIEQVSPEEAREEAQHVREELESGGGAAH